MTDREFWLMVRRALLLFIKAIDMRYLRTPVNGHAPEMSEEAERVKPTI